MLQAKAISIRNKCTISFPDFKCSFRYQALKKAARQCNKRPVKIHGTLAALERFRAQLTQDPIDIEITNGKEWITCCEGPVRVCRNLREFVMRIIQEIHSLGLVPFTPITLVDWTGVGKKGYLQGLLVSATETRERRQCETRDVHAFAKLIGIGGRYFKSPLDFTVPEITQLVNYLMYDKEEKERLLLSSFRKANPNTEKNIMALILNYSETVPQEVPPPDLLGVEHVDFDELDHITYSLVGLPDDYDDDDYEY